MIIHSIEHKWIHYDVKPENILIRRTVNAHGVPEVFFTLGMLFMILIFSVTSSFFLSLLYLTVILYLADFGNSVPNAYLDTNKPKLTQSLSNVDFFFFVHFYI